MFLFFVFLFFGKNFCMNFCYAVFFNVHNGEFNALIFHNGIFVLFGNSSKDIHDKSGKGIVFRVVINFDSEKFFDIAEKNSSFEVKVIVVDGADFFFLVVVFVLDIAHDGFDKVFHGNKSCGTAIFINNNGCLDLFLLELCKSFAAAVRFGNEIYGADKIFDFSSLDGIITDESEKVFCIDNAFDIIDGFLINGHS